MADTPKSLTRASSKYKELIGELPPNSFFKAKAAAASPLSRPSTDAAPSGSPEPVTAIVVAAEAESPKLPPGTMWCARTPIDRFHSLNIVFHSCQGCSSYPEPIHNRAGSPNRSKASRASVPTLLGAALGC